LSKEDYGSDISVSKAYSKSRLSNYGSNNFNKSPSSNNNLYGAVRSHKESLLSANNFSHNNNFNSQYNYSNFNSNTNQGNDNYSTQFEN
jgi:hypothetical protein